MKRILLFLAFFTTYLSLSGQGTIVTYPPLTNNNGAAGITFEVESTMPVNITDLKNYFFSGTGTVEVWYRIGGVQHIAGSAPDVSVANGWVQHFNGTITASGSGPESIQGWTDMGVPANQRVGIAIFGSPSSNYQSWSSSSPDVFSDGVLTVYTGQNIGYGGGGTWPNHPRQFLGEVTYELGILGDCQPFSNFTIDSISADAAKVDWTPGTGNSSFYLEYGPSGFAPGTGTMITGAHPGAQPPVILTGLSPQTAYDVYFGELCNSNGDSAYFPTAQLFETTELCASPTDFQGSNVTANSVDLSWNQAGTVQEYWIIWGAVGFDPSTGGNVDIVTSMSHILTGLNPVSSYDIYLATNCAGGNGVSDTVGPVSISTPIQGPAGVNCPANDPVTFLSEEFEDIQAVQANVWTGDISTSDGDWKFETNSTGSGSTGPTGPHSGGGYIYFEGSSSGPAELVSPVIDLTSATDGAELAFWLHAYGDDINYLLIEASTASATGPFNDTLFYYDQELQTSSSDPWQQVGVNLDQYLGQQLWVRFTADELQCCSGDIAIDLLTVETCGDICIPPSALTVTNITVDSADLGWTDASGATSWDIELGAVGFSPIGAPTNAGVLSNPFRVGNLQANSNYDFYVRSNCGGGTGQSAWSGPFSFATSLAGPQGVTCPANNSAAVFSAEFDDQGAWSGDIGTFSGQWQFNSGGTTTGNTGPSGAHSGSNYIYFESNGAGPASLISPAINLVPATDGAELSFWLHAYGDDIGYLLAKVSTVSENGPFNDTIFLYNSGELQTTSADPWQQVGLSLNNYLGQTIWIEFEADRSASTNGDIALDLVEINTCGDFCLPEIYSLDSITVNSFTDATVYADTSGDAFQLEWGPCGYTQGTGTFITGNSPINISGLTHSTCYDVYVRRNCGGANGFSGWAGPFTFNTPCMLTAPAVLPVTEGFETYTDPMDEAGTMFCGPGYRWDVERPGGSGSIVFDGSPSSGPSGVYAGSQAAGFQSLTSSDPIYLILTADLTSYASSAYPIELSFYFADHADENHNGDHVWVRGSDSDPWVEILDWNAAGASSDWGYFAINIDSVLNANSQSFSTTTQVRWGQQDNAALNGADGFSLDEVRVAEVTCPEPVALGIDSLTPSSAYLRWRPGTFGNTDFEVSIGENINSASSGTVYTVTSDSAFSVTGLLDNASYCYYVREICGVGDESRWAGPYCFQTPCFPLSAPFSETFDNTSIPSCWITYSSTGETFDFTNNSYAPSSDHTGNSGQYASVDDSESPATADITLQGPLVDVSSLTNPVLSFHVASADASVMLSVDAYDGSTWYNGVFTYAAASTSTWDSLDVSLLPYAGSGIVSFRFVINEDNGTYQNDFAIDDVRITEGPSCPDPTQVSFSRTSASTADLAWTSIIPGQNYFVEHGPVGFAVGTGTAVTTSTTSASITGVPAGNVPYEAYVRSYCTPGDTSNWVGPISLSPEPCEDFEIYSAGPIAGQSSLIIPWDGASQDAEISSTYAYSGTQSLHIHDTGANATSDVVALFDSAYTSGVHEVEFAFYIPPGDGGYYNILHSYTGPANVWAIEVYLDSTGTARVDAGTNGTGTIGTYTFEIGAWNLVEHIIDLDNDTAWIRINDVTTTVGWQWSFGSSNLGDQFNAVNMFAAANPGQTPNIYFDDLCVSAYVPPSCPSPGYLSATDIGGDSAVVYWTPFSGGNDFELSYGINITYPDSGVVVQLTDTVHNLSGLTPDETYCYFVREVCSPGDTSDWAGPYCFATQCPTLTPLTLPFSDGFENYTGPISADGTFYCGNNHTWSVERPGGTGDILFSYSATSGASAPNSGLQSAGLQSLSSNDPIYLIFSTDLSAYTGLSSDVRLSFHFADHADETSAGDKVWTRGSASEPWVEILDWNSAGATSGWSYFEISLDSALNANGQALSAMTQIRWGQQDNAALNGNDGFSVDDLLIRAVTCPEPGELNAGNVTGNSADLWWTPGTSGNQNFEVSIGAGIASPDSGTSYIASDSTFAVSGLTKNTEYCYFVREICAVGDSSLWVGPFCFSTPMLFEAEATEIILTPESCGDNAATVEVAFTNNGFDPITSLPITVNVSGTINTSFTATYTGSLPQFGSDTLMMGTLNTFTGDTITVEAIVVLPGDEETSNDTIIEDFEIEDVTAPVPTAALGSVGCGGYDTLYHPVGSDDDFLWLTTNGDTIGSSDSLAVGPIGQSDTTFVLYTVPGQSYSVGPVDKSIGSAGNFANVDFQQLYFTAYEDFTIEEMTVHPNGNGDVHVNLVDAATGTILQTAIVPVTGVNTPGEAKRITVDMDVTPGSYELHGGGSTTGGLWRNSNGANYPYSVPGVVDITGNSFGSSYYYYFYDWQISTGSCPKDNALITIQSTGGSVVPAFTYSIGGATNRTVDFDASATTGATSYTWDFDDGNNGSGVNPQHTYAADGTYNVTMVASGPCGADSVTDVVTIQGTVCNAPTGLDATNITASSAGLEWRPGAFGNTDFQLSFGTGISTPGAGTMTVLTDSSYQATGLTSSTNYCYFVREICAVSDTSAWAGPYCFTTNATTPTCQPVTNLVLDTTMCDAVTITWTSNTGNSIIEHGPTGFTPGTGTTSGTVTSPYTITGLTAGTDYDVLVADVCANDTSAFSGPVTVSTDTVPKPIASFTVVNDSISGGQAYVSFDATATTGATSYSWDFGDGSSGTGATFQTAYGANGAYTVVLTATNACGTDTAMRTVNVTGIDLMENALGRSLGVYPNPTQGKITVEFSAQGSADAMLRITDLRGKEIRRSEYHNVNGRFNEELSLEGLAKGVYMIEISSGDMRAYRRVTLQ